MLAPSAAALQVKAVTITDPPCLVTTQVEGQGTRTKLKQIYQVLMYKSLGFYCMVFQLFFCIILKSSESNCELDKSMPIIPLLGSSEIKENRIHRYSDSQNSDFIDINNVCILTLNQ